MSQLASRARSRSRLTSSQSDDTAQDGRRRPGSPEPDREHFRRFLSEQSRWLSYDAYSRICMALGMNQMLQALAYYTQGVLWASSPVAACTTFFAIKFLGLLLMKLDVGFGHNGWPAGAPGGHRAAAGRLRPAERLRGKA
ncbi:unnamed protein product [Prorocentrum cordatum]|uniref:Autophagy-related protein 9 n=1 Tax=Prorocentrum cordatum TaxID=2364126 RepID=A0ABN9TBM7_9DINO|nr:unnamed protein product [Polarella glacialis]